MTMLSREELAEVASIFGDAVDLDPAARVALLDARCGSRVEMRAEVDSLLASHERVDSFMESSVREEARADSQQGAVVGAWRLLEKIGSGGMGDVYLAERGDGAFEGRAAVKFTHAHLRDEDAARRFRAERQFLASLHHPDIVTLLDGGTTPDGQGYLVMEYVEGTPISTFCRSSALALDARLALMQRVCTAVQYAHQRAIVHLDLKPTNILVTEDGVPKILDFGVGKLLEGAAADGTLTIAALPRAVTPNYASPEQLRGLPVTTACDVYALGVLLYEVVAGARPYETTGQTLDAVIRTVVDTEPPRPSASLSETPLPYPRTSLRGDLDAIVLKAMRKEPDERYRSAGELGDDLGRVLGREVVVARAPSMGYVMRRVAARHRGAVTIAAAALIAIVGALGLALWQRQIAVDAQRQSERRFKEVRQLANALIFKIHDSVAKLPGSTPVRREIVDEALGYLVRLERESAGDAALQMELAGAYRQIAGILGDPQFPNLGDRPGALAQATKAVNLVRPLADAPQATEEALTAIVEANRLLGRIADDGDRRLALAEETVRYSEKAVSRSMPRGKEMLARALFALAGNVEPQAAKLPHWERTRQLYEALLLEKPEDPVRQRNVALVGRNLGGVLGSLGRDAEAQPHFERALALDERRLAANPDNRMARLDTAIEYNQLGALLIRTGHTARAIELIRKSLIVRQALAESDPEDVLTRSVLGSGRSRLARIEFNRGERELAYALARQAVEDHEVVRAKTKSSTSAINLGDSLLLVGEHEWARGHREAACRFFTRAIDLVTPVPETADATEVLQRARGKRAACGD